MPDADIMRETLLRIGAQHPVWLPASPQLEHLINTLFKDARTAVEAEGATDDDAADWCSAQLEPQPAMEPVETAFTAYAKEWTSELHDAGAKEGWFLCTCEGSSYGPLQLDKVDDPIDAAQTFGYDFTIPELEDDEAAWRIVKDGTGPHHEKARDLLARFNPEELQRVMNVQPKESGDA